MLIVSKKKHIVSGQWNTLETARDGVDATVVFSRELAGTIRIRHGLGFLGWNAQKQRLDGTKRKLTLNGRRSKSVRRAQIRPDSDRIVTYEYQVELSNEERLEARAGAASG